MFAQLAKGQRRKAPRMGTAQLPAPTRGLNLADGIASMKPDDALILDNMFCEASYLRVRGGHTEHVTGLGAAVQTLMEWAGPSSRKMFAATPTAIYDVTSPGAVGAAAVSGLTNGYWQSQNITTAGGAFMIAANGSDPVRSYDGTTWAAPAITGVDPADLFTLTLHKTRLWFLEVDSMTAWYLGVSSIAGAATAFPLGTVFMQGDSLAAIGTVSRDGGSGSDDYLVFVSHHGEVAVYQLADPGSPTGIALVGVYQAAAPIGNRAIVKVGGDLGILTEAGIISVRQLIGVGREAAQKVAITARINRGFSDAYAAYGAFDGWMAIVHPRTRQAMFNVPTAADTAFQFAMNVETGAWSRYINLNATSWGMLSEDLYFGTAAGTVYKAETGHSDNGANIQWQVKTSFQPYGQAGGVKRITQVRPLFSAGGQVVPAIRINVDYRNDTPMTPDAFPAVAGTGGGIWDVSLWDVGVWGDSTSPYDFWYSAAAVGNVASVNMGAGTNGIEVLLNAIDLQYEVGARLAI